MKINKLLITSLLFLILISENFALNDVVIKLTPNNVETDGNLVKFNITAENIPPKDSLKTPNNNSIKDGGCQGMDVYINYSDDYLSPISFNWSDKCNNVKIKEYDFGKSGNGTFFLSIMFDEPIYDSSINLGTIVFNPIKKGKTNLNVSGKVSSENGFKYDGVNSYAIDYGKKRKHYPYPNTKFYGATVNIKEIGNYTGSTNLNGELNENTVSSSSSTTINKINVITNQSMPKIIVKEINVSEEKPNITVIINTDKKDSINYNLLIYTFIGSILSGIIFGLILRRR